MVYRVRNNYWSKNTLETNIATYRQIQDYVKGKYGFIPKFCWIADVKEQVGLPVRCAWNRIGDQRINP